MDALHIKLKPEAERLIAEICVTAYLRHLNKQSEQAAISDVGEAKKEGDAA